MTVGYHENTFYIEMYLNPMTKCIMYSLNQTLNCDLDNLVLERCYLISVLIQWTQNDLLALNVLIYMMKHIATPTTPPQKFGANFTH